MKTNLTDIRGMQGGAFSTAAGGVSSSDHVYFTLYSLTFQVCETAARGETPHLALI